MYRVHENDKGPNVFRDIEKKYKAVYGKKKKLKPCDFGSVIDFSTPDRFPNIRQQPNKKTNSKYWNEIPQIYSLDNVPGFYFIPNPFTPEQQREWVRKCITKYPVSNPTNISNLNKTAPITEFSASILNDIRWTALGYHFQWTERIYSEKFRGPFPEDLAELVSDLAATVDETIVAEAAIINYYPDSKCKMGAHVDDAEEEMTKPIVSLSFGNSVVFLIGGRSRSVIPSAIFIRSGDIVIMSGESRYCYHSVPRMISGTVPQFLVEKNEEGEEAEICRNYIQDARINMNCRQVKKIT